ncbi:TraB/GumN family protein [Paenibacillus paeoniae]|uniref:Polysaccharide biosynthesis protein GumN n=1 Tax=Paenibacillus paeoniae TaxID=2292705 RepID=A0A371PHF0_9BACL|nr:TraB/GumN family protein [Paenibacillus paeoniae]REK75564.1 polysaccharide biosynthesis protein GumN [Paenibacillus paeoniae]
MKKIIVSLLFLTLLTSTFSTIQAADHSLSIQLNGEKVQFGKSAPILEKGITLVPIHPLMDKMGIKWNWDETSRTISGTKEDFSFSLQIGSKKATANGKAVQLDATPKQSGNVSYVPIRFVAEAVGYQVAWDSSLRQVSLNSKQQSEGGRGFLWKIENKGNTVYLLGTMHLADENMYPLRPEIENAFNAADYLGVEVDLMKGASEESKKRIAELSVYKDGTKLQDHISAETYKKVAAFLKEQGLPENSFDHFKTWFVEKQILFIKSSQGEQKQDMGIDIYLIAKAHQAKKPVISLENMDLQFQAMDNFSDSLNERLLLQTLEPGSPNPPTPDVSVDVLAKMWSEGDYNALAEASKFIGWDAEWVKAQMDDRNVPMVEKIKGYLNSDKKETYFIGVGSLHLLGDMGMVTLLEKEGFKLVRQ